MNVGYSPVVVARTGTICASAGTGLDEKTARHAVNTGGIKALVFMTRHRSYLAAFRVGNLKCRSFVTRFQLAWYLTEGPRPRQS
jgi:hypothetical protein